VQLFPGNFEDTSTVNAAVEGATAVFLNVIPTFPDSSSEVAHAKTIIDADSASGTVFQCGNDGKARSIS
jgi:hypothetical protein